MDKIYIDRETGKLVNIFAPYKGRSRLDTAEIRAAVGVVEVDRDAPPVGYVEHPDWYNVREDWETTQRPYICYYRKTDQQIADIQLAQAKAQRAAAVASIVVTTGSGKPFDGHEDAQNRMGRVINIMGDSDTIPWVLADNRVSEVSRDELIEAMRLAGLEQARLWVIPYGG